MVSTFLDFSQIIVYNIYIESSVNERNANDHFLNKKESVI